MQWLREKVMGRFNKDLDIPERVWQSYLDVVLSITSPNGEVQRLFSPGAGLMIPPWLRELLQGLGGSGYILSAWNPASIEQEMQINVARSVELGGAIANRGWRAFYAKGSSVDESYFEEGYAVIGGKIDEVASLAVEFGQFAFYCFGDERLECISCDLSRVDVMVQRGR